VHRVDQARSERLQQSRFVTRMAISGQLVLDVLGRFRCPLPLVPLPAAAGFEEKPAAIAVHVLGKTAARPTGTPGLDRQLQRLPTAVCRGRWSCHLDRPLVILDVICADRCHLRCRAAYAVLLAERCARPGLYSVRLSDVAAAGLCQPLAARLRLRNSSTAPAGERGASRAQNIRGRSGISLITSSPPAPNRCGLRGLAGTAWSRRPAVRSAMRWRAGWGAIRSTWRIRAAWRLSTASGR
jgi:hypothetical protein